MDFVRFLTFTILAITCSADSYYKIVSYRNLDRVTNENPFANVEVHCFRLNQDQIPIYVRGTYGQRGYFEGPVVDGTANVNYIEVDYTNETGLTPSVGTGILKYDATYNVAFGAQSTLQDGDLSYWAITANNNYFGAPSEWTAAQIAEQYCFWDITDTSNYAQDHFQFKLWKMLGFTNPNTWSISSVGFQQSFRGSIAGAYRYTYSIEDCNNLSLECCQKGRVEWGIYSPDTVHMRFNSSYVLATKWKATSGPLSGASGSGLYALVTDTDGKAKQIGFFCNSERNVHYPFLPYKKILTSCFFDSNNHEQPDTAESRQLFQTLLNTNREYTWWRNVLVRISNIFVADKSDPETEVDRASVAAPSTTGVKMLEVVASWWKKVWT
eukprot:gene4525-4851_t